MAWHNMTLFWPKRWYHHGRPSEHVLLANHQHLNLHSSGPLGEAEFSGIHLESSGSSPAKLDRGPLQATQTGRPRNDGRFGDSLGCQSDAPSAALRHARPIRRSIRSFGFSITSHSINEASSSHTKAITKTSTS